MTPDEVELGDDVTELLVSRKPQAGVVLSVRVPPELVAPLEALAAQDGVYLSVLARQALMEYVTRRGTNLADARAPQTSASAGWVFVHVR